MTDHECEARDTCTFDDACPFVSTCQNVDSSTSEVRRLVEVVQAADGFKQHQLTCVWPELAEAVAGVIEGMTDQDAPRGWWRYDRSANHETRRGPSAYAK